MTQESMTFVVAIIAFVASMISVFVSVTQNRKNRLINTITTNRVEWMEKLRTQISAYCSLCWHYSVSNKNIGREEGVQIQAEIDRTGILIRLLLNPYNPTDTAIINRLTKMRHLIFDNEIGDLLREIELLTTDSQKLLKDVWEEVKAEARRGDLKNKGVIRTAWIWLKNHLPFILRNQSD